MLTPPFSLAELNQCDFDTFREALGDVFEHSPWVAGEVYSQRPFQSVDDLHHGMVEIVRQSSHQSRLELLRAHPELGGEAAGQGTLTRSSADEQGHAGLLQLDAEEQEEITRLNHYYQDKFGFPFVMAVRRRTKSSIFSAWRRRLDNNPETEFAAALEEVYIIARLRLDALIGEH